MNVEDFANRRLDSMLARPGMWGNMGQVEFQFLFFVSLLIENKLGEEATSSRLLHDLYSKFCNKHKYLSSIYLHQQIDNMDEMIKLLSEFREEINEGLQVG